jgi:protein TonB
MFESAFALETPGRRSPLLISFTIQAATVAVVLLIPLYYVEQLTVMPTMPVPVYAPKLPHMKILSVIREAASSLAPRLTQPSVRRALTAPARISALDRQPVTFSDVGVPQLDAIPGSIPFDSPLVPQTRIAPAPVSEPKPVAKPAVKTGPVRVGGTVQEAKLIHQVKPAYPPLARQVRIQGTVRLQAVIAKDGTIQNLQLSTGHPLLVPSAMEAVRQWRYSPTTLNGEVVEVLTQIDVNFTLQ